MTRPSGGSLLWVELPARRWTRWRLHAQALEAGISIAPGPIFSARMDSYRHFIRLNCGHPWTPRIEAAMSTLGALARSLT